MATSNKFSATIISWQNVKDITRAMVFEHEEFKLHFEEDERAFTAIVDAIMDEEIPYVQACLKTVRKRPRLRNIGVKKTPVLVTEPLAAYLLFGYAFDSLLDKVADLQNEVQKFLAATRQTDLVIFVGAGVSFESEVGWHSVAVSLASALDVDADEIERQLSADPQGTFARLTSDELKRFQETFSNYIINGKSAKPNEAHSLLAELTARERVEHLICFNWDNFIEQEYRTETNVLPQMESPNTHLLHAEWFWKPHGCVTRRELRWVLPSDPVQIPDSLREELRRPSARVVICFGFRGTADFNKRELVAWLGKGTRIYDVRPGLKAPESLGIPIPYSGTTMLRKILNHH